MALNATKIKEAHVTKLDLDAECAYDLAIGQGLRLQSTESFHKSEKVEDGLQSPFFGTDFSDELSFAERYRCQCGYMIGMMYQGELCPKCGTPVGYVPVDMKKMGWIILDHFKVMSPIYAYKLSEALGTVEGEKVLTKILSKDFDQDESDEHAIILREKEDELRKKHPFVYKGTQWFVDHFEEVIKYYMTKKPGKKKLFEELLHDKDHVFTSSIPVISATLRSETPGEKDRKLIKFRINTIYSSIIRLTNEINELGDIKNMSDNDLITTDRYLCAIHKKLLQLFDEIFNILNGKKGTIASRIIAGRYNASARNIISASSGELRSNEVDICYLDAMELFRYELTNLYAKLKSCTIEEAQQAWYRATRYFDPVFYGIIKYMITHNRYEIGVIINRNPSINFGSFMYVKIHDVIPNIDNKTMRLNTRVIRVMAADFDGDQLNIFRIIGKDLNRRFARTMDPRYNLYIDRINGRVNRDMLPLKDEVVGFWYFNSCD